MTSYQICHDPGELVPDGLRSQAVCIPTGLRRVTGVQSNLTILIHLSMFLGEHWGITMTTQGEWTASSTAMESWWRLVPAV